MNQLGSKKVFTPQSKFGRWYYGKFIATLQGSFVGILAPLTIAVLTSYFFVSRYSDDMKSLEKAYVREQSANTLEVSNNISAALRQVHTGIRTVALQSELGSLSEKPLRIETQATISQILSNLSLSLSVDAINIHIAGKNGLEKTYRFDSATAMKREPNQAARFPRGQSEVSEIFHWFAEKFPRNSYASLMDYPARLFGSTTLRYAVPFFHQDQTIAGLVTCDIPRSAIQTLLPNANLALVDPIASNMIYTEGPGTVESSKEYVLQGEKAPNQIYSQTISADIPDKRGNWVLWALNFDQDFYRRDEVREVKVGLFTGLLAIWLVALTTILGIHSLKYRQERRFQSLVRNSQEIIVVVSPTGFVYNTVGQLKALSGWKPEDLRNLDLRLFLHEKSRPVLDKLIKGVTDDQHQTETGEIMLENSEGSHTWYEATATNMLDEPGLSGILVTLRNIEARKNSERMTIAAKESAERANEAKSEFLSRMSHELRTPLNAILGFGQLLEMSSLDKRDEESVEQIMKAGRHLLTLVNDILDIARIETRKMSLSMESVSCDDVISESVTLISPLANREKIQIHVDVDSEVFVLADNQRLKQVLLNLLSNAVKYNRANGEVFLSVAAKNSTVQISVRDTGNGIDASGINRLFTPFDRLGADRSSIEGSGLGLALSKTMIEAMGGHIDVDSSVGVGTTFTVTLSSAVESNREEERQTRHAHLTVVDGGIKKLLYIEDNLANLKLVHDILAFTPGFELLTAVQGGLGIEIADLHCPEIILLDIDLPDISGLEVLKSLRENPKNAEATIIVMSADASENKVQQVFELGADDYLAKPINIKRFISLINQNQKVA